MRPLHPLNVRLQRPLLVLHHRNVPRLHLVVQFHPHLQHVHCRRLVVQFRRRLVVVQDLVVLVVVPALVLACALVLVDSALVVLVLVLVCALVVLVARVKVVLAAPAGNALVVLAVVPALVPALALVLAVLVLAVVLVARVQVVDQVVLLVAVVQVVAVRDLMANVVRHERSRVRVVVVSLRNCSRNLRRTRHQMHPYQKARSSLSVLHLHKSLLRS